MEICRIEKQGTIILITPVGSGEDSVPMLTAEDRAFLEGMKPGPRRSSRAAWRAAARSELGKATIGYDGDGAPVIEGSDKYTHIGVSHSRRHAAVILSNNRCAIDIEDTQRDFNRASSRFLSPEESALPENGSPLFKAAVWCAKETLYKFCGHRSLDFLNDLRIMETDLQRGLVIAGIRNGGEEWSLYTLGVFLYGTDMVVWMAPEQGRD